MEWSEVGSWLKSNAGPGAALVGSLMTGNVPGAVSAGIALASSATGVSDPAEVLAQFQSDPRTVVKLKELVITNEENIRSHLEEMTGLELADKQAQHKETQQTIRTGDTAEDPFVRRTRPAQSWISLIAALVYVFIKDTPDIYVLGALLTLPWAYAGLRQVGKGVEAWANTPSKKS